MTEDWRTCKTLGLLPDQRGRFGPYGGAYAPETLIPALSELELAYEQAKMGPTLRDELPRLLKDYVGRPTPLYRAANLSQLLGARIYLKREDLCHTGAHKINNALGQALLARDMGKTRIIAETGAGQHGVATATACALVGLKCFVYMGAEDMRRQALNVDRMRLLGAEVIEVASGSQTLKDATNEAMRDWVASVRDTHYVIGSAVGPHPFPMIVRDLQAVIGAEARQQILIQANSLPDIVIACVGGGSNAIGIFTAFLDDPVELIGVEAAGKGLETDAHCATLGAGQPGILHGSLSYLLQDSLGQVGLTHSISAGLDYPGVGPEHAFLMEIGRVRYRSVTDAEALQAASMLAQTEGIIPALESAHAIAAIKEIAAGRGEESLVLVNLSGRGDKDMDTLSTGLSDGDQQ